MNVLLDQLKEAQRIGDDGLVALIHDQIAYMNYENSPKPSKGLLTHPDFFKVGKRRNEKMPLVVFSEEFLKPNRRKVVKQEEPPQAPAPPVRTKLQENLANSESVTDLIAKAVKNAAAKKFD